MTAAISGILVMGSSEIGALLDLDRCIEVVEEAFKARAQGKTLNPGLLHTDAPHGDFHVKTGGLDVGKLYFGLKANGRYPENQQRFGLPNVSGVIYLADGDDGTPVALMDSALITLNRTGAAAAVAAKFLANPGPAVATICGCGKQGRIQLAAIARVRPLERAFAYGRDPERVRAFAEEMSRKLEISVVPAPSLHEATSQSNIVVTCTPAREFFLGPADIRPGTFIAAIGADSSYKQELDPRLIADNKLVVDIAAQAAHVGELHHAIDQGLMTIEDVHAELGEVIAGKKPGRTHPGEIIIFDSTGTALQDIAVASMVYEQATQAGKGTRISLRD